MKNGDIPHENIQASGYITKGDGWSFYPWLGRLNSEGEKKFWAEWGYKADPWIQADIGYQTSVAGVITQGDGNQEDKTPVWVTTLKVSTFKNSTKDNEVFVKGADGNVKVSP